MCDLPQPERNWGCHVLFIKRSPLWKSQGHSIPHALPLYTLLLHLTLQPADALFGLHTQVENSLKSLLFVQSIMGFQYSSLIWFLHVNSDDRAILDESDQFMLNPADFVTHMFRNVSLPSHLVLFDSQEIHLRELLISHSFQQVNLLSIYFLLPICCSFCTAACCLFIWLVHNLLPNLIKHYHFERLL